MPDMADITVKKNDGTTDVVYAKQVASAGDTVPAIWRGPVGSAAAFSPEFRMVARPSKDRGVRRIECMFAFPHVVVGPDGVSRVTDITRVQLSALVPQKAALTETNEAVAQGLNLMAATLVKTSVQTGYAPT